MKTCPRCGKLHSKPGTYCSRSCANVRTKSEEVKEKTRRSVIQHLIKNGKHPKPTVQLICKTCGQTFMGKPNRQFCSQSCASKFHKEHAIAALKLAVEKLKSEGRWGGYREGSGRAKHGYYKGIYCGSTYELVWLIYQLDNGKSVERFQGELEWNGVKYIPDFIQDGKIIELKGYEAQESVDRKSAVANHFGYEVMVLRKEDLKKEFDWVREHYHYHDLEELYDTYQPKFKYKCAYCGNEFTRNKQLHTSHVCCSRVCAGKLAAKRLNGTIE